MKQFIGRLKYFVAAGLFVLTSIVLSGGPVLAHDHDGDPSGNNGTIQVHEKGEVDFKKSNDPQVCIFNLEVFAVDAGQTGSVTIVPQSPTTANGTPNGNPLVLSLTTDSHGNGATAYVNDGTSGFALQDGHYKATLDNKFGTDSGNKAKSKVFWVNCLPIASTITTQASAATVHVGDSVHDTATLSGDFNHGAVTGTVDFYLCGPNLLANPDCTSGGVSVGTATISSGQAVSGDYMVTAAGAYCFRAEYTPGNTVKYLSATHTNLTTECFTASDLPGTITVTKVVHNNHGGTAAAADFPLYVNATQVASGAKNTFAIGQAYTVSEQGGPSGYTQADLTCTDGAGNPLGAHFTLNGGEDVSCIITNEDVAPLLTVTKHVTNTYGGTKWASEFNLRVNGSLLLPQDAKKGGGTLADNSVTYEYPNAVAGTLYTISEDAASGYSQQSLICVDTDTQAIVTQPVVLALGQRVECTITNTDQPATISGTKYEVNADGGHVGVTGLSGWTIELHDASDNLVASTTTDSNGNYSFSNLYGGSTYRLFEVLKTGWTQILSPSPVSLVAGQASTGNNFGNFRNATVQGYKWNDVNGNGKYDSGEAKLSGWAIKLYDDNGALVDTAVTDGNGNYQLNDVASGVYKVCEVQQYGWVQTYPAADDGCQTVTVAQSGQTYEADFGNQGHGTISVTKFIDPSTDPGVFDLQVDGVTARADASNGDSTDPVDVVAGTHTVGELGGANTNLGDYDSYYECYQGDEAFLLSGNTATSDSFTVSPGDSVACYFVNTRHASLTVVKKAYPFGTSQAFTFTLGEVTESGTNVLKTFQLDDNNDPTLPNSRTDGLAPGVYEITEASTFNWNLLGVDCGDASVTKISNGVRVTLEAGQQLSCTFTNQQHTIPQVLGESTTVAGGHGQAMLADTGEAPLLPTLLALLLPAFAATAMYAKRAQRNPRG